MARVRDLIEALLESQPILAEDSTFLRRALVVGGVNSLILPVHLESFFTRYGAVMATVLLRDAARGERIGMLVFFSESDCLEAAESEAARPGAYRTISRVDDEILHNSVELVKDAADQQSRRSSTAEAFRRMADAQEDIQLRCLLLRTWPRSTATPSHLYGVARTTLRATGRVCAVVVYRSRSMAMVVFDESRGIERCGSRETQLFDMHLALHDAGLYPLVADRGGGHGAAMRDLLPPFCRSPEFLGRIVVLRGPGVASLDAGEVCRRVEELHHPVEALLVHRADRLAVVVLRSRDDARALMSESGEFWRRACGPQPITTQLIGAPSPPFFPRQGLFPAVVQLATAHIHAMMLPWPRDSYLQFGRRLVELESLRTPSFVRGGNLPQRATSGVQDGASPEALLRAIRPRRELRRLHDDGGGHDHLLHPGRLLRFRMLLLTRDVSNLMEEAGPLAYEDALPVDLANDLLLPGPGAGV
uniref:RRM domain-containing protein n=1 Tax=Oryza glumipatula TaxID=40148 RepID=A0A0E0AN08_9ORYZ